MRLARPALGESLGGRSHVLTLACASVGDELVGLMARVAIPRAVLVGVRCVVSPKLLDILVQALR